MAKPTPTKEEQGFVFQLGKDMARIGFEIESLKNKTVKAIRIVVPGKPEKYQKYGLRAVINLPPEYQHAICIKSKNGEISLVETKETLSVYSEYEQSEFCLAPIYRLEAETITAELDQEQIELIESNIEREQREHEQREHEQREHEQREREQREREQREREQREREQREDYLKNYVYYALVKYAKNKYSNELKEKELLDDIKLVPNWESLGSFLANPFLKLENGIVMSYKDYLENTQDIINDLKNQVSRLEAEKKDIEDGLSELDFSKLDKPTEYRFDIL